MHGDKIIVITFLILAVPALCWQGKEHSQDLAALLWCRSLLLADIFYVSVDYYPDEVERNL